MDTHGFPVMGLSTSDTGTSLRRANGCGCLPTTRTVEAKNSRPTFWSRQPASGQRS